MLESWPWGQFDRQQEKKTQTQKSIQKFPYPIQCWILLWYLFNHHVTIVACKRPWSFCQKCRQQVTAKHVYSFTQWSQNRLSILSWHSAGINQKNKPTCNPLQNTHPQSSQLAQSLWTGLWFQTADVHFRKKKEEKVQMGIIHLTFSHNPCKRGKSYQHHYQI